MKSSLAILPVIQTQWRRLAAGAGGRLALGKDSPFHRMQAALYRCNVALNLSTVS